MSYEAHVTDTAYCYDGSFAGFLCCVFESYARRATVCGSGVERPVSHLPTACCVTPSILDTSAWLYRLALRASFKRSANIGKTPLYKVG